MLLSSVLGIRANLKQQHFEYDEELARLSVVGSFFSGLGNSARNERTYVSFFLV